MGKSIKTDVFPTPQAKRSLSMIAATVAQRAFNRTVANCLKVIISSDMDPLFPACLVAGWPHCVKIVLRRSDVFTFNNDDRPHIAAFHSILFFPPSFDIGFKNHTNIRREKSSSTNEDYYLRSPLISLGWLTPYIKDSLLKIFVFPIHSSAVNAGKETTQSVGNYGFSCVKEG